MVAKFSDAAIADLETIREWIAADSVPRAAAKVELIIEVCQLLERQPGMGRAYSADVRYFSKRPWIIVYSLAENEIRIQRIFDGRQDWRSQLAHIV